ncbi:hypothetical protein MAR_034454 [Mya arenaria]|uniref:Uncharacterized protein n=1 Tax=Mya arenaria TaxID=6604 RepID=A0ABY7GBY6_MYAAR|nr:hypothetical protein MAR_034454 [Mya arenaria]
MTSLMACISKTVIHSKTCIIIDILQDLYFCNIKYLCITNKPNHCTMKDSHTMADGSAVSTFKDSHTMADGSALSTFKDKNTIEQGSKLHRHASIEILLHKIGSQ